MSEGPLTDQRTDVIRLLHAAAADGRLTLDQADRRIASARAATSEGVLDTLVADLAPAAASAASALPAEPAAPATSASRAGADHPVPVQVEQYPPVVASHVVTPPRREPGFAPEHPLRLSAGTGSAKRTGAWRVPPYIAVNGGLGGSVKLDLLLATPTSSVVWLVVEGSAGSVTVVLPQGWGVVTDELGSGIGSVSNKLPVEPDPGFPLLVVSGSVGVGSFTARHANWWERRRLRKATEKRLEIMR